MVDILFPSFPVLSRVLLLVLLQPLWLLMPPPPLVARLPIAPTVPAGSHVVGKQKRLLVLVLALVLVLVLLVLLKLLPLLVVACWRRGWRSVGALSISYASTPPSCTIRPLLILVPQFPCCVKVLSICWRLLLLLLLLPWLLFFLTRRDGGVYRRMSKSRRRTRRSLDGDQGRA